MGDCWISYQMLVRLLVAETARRKLSAKLRSYAKLKDRDIKESNSGRHIIGQFLVAIVI